MLAVFRDSAPIRWAFSRRLPIFLMLTLLLAALAWFSPYPPTRTFMTPQDLPPSWAHPFGTNSRGQDLLWWMAFAVRNSLILGVITAVVSRLIAIFVGLVSGYRGGFIDRALMSANDSFVVLAGVADPGLAELLAARATEPGHACLAVGAVWLAVGRAA
ncbi:MAG: hypothetical protein KatS3mg048_2423 [Caldilinea sp.]|nr:hypothetical protein [Caldilinea sp.]GIV69561.1 MAG: hypothetical protein KatS3mg048_2423 [Caldilinea sp.]